METVSAPFRYVWPSEPGLMARLAGMILRERWSDKQRAPFTGDSRSHISVGQQAPSRGAARLAAGGPEDRQGLVRLGVCIPVGTRPAPR